jgi:hypothetical protein
MAFFLFFYLTPWRFISGGPIFCPFQRVFGIPCLGCGMTRAFWEMIHLHFGNAFSDNALSFLFFPGIVLLMFWDIYRGIKVYFHLKEKRNGNL